MLKTIEILFRFPQAFGRLHPTHIHDPKRSIDPSISKSIIQSKTSTWETVIYVKNWRRFLQPNFQAKHWKEPSGGIFLFFWGAVNGAKQYEYLLMPSPTHRQTAQQTDSIKKSTNRMSLLLQYNDNVACL